MKLLCASLKCKYSSENEDCSNVVFINFPNDDIAKIWAYNCGRIDLLTKSNEELHANYYICSDHIEDRHYISKLDPIMIAHNAIPTLFDNTFDMSNRHEYSETENSTYHNIDAEINQCHSFAIKIENLCRICGESKSDLIEIFSTRGIELEIQQKISIHLPMSSDLENLLPQNICNDCFEKLEIIHSLVKQCLKTDLRMRRIFNIKNIPNYSLKFHNLVEECLLAVTNNLSIEEKNTNDLMSSQNSQRECLNDKLKEVQMSTEQCILQNDNIQAVKDTKKIKNFNNVESVGVQIVEKKKSNGIICLHCNDIFKTREIFENHKILCDEEEITNLENRDKRLSDIQYMDCFAKSSETYEEKSGDNDFFNKNEKSVIEVLKLKHSNNKDIQQKLNDVIKRCGYCTASYSTKKELISHITASHNDKPLFRCYLCEKSYTRWSSLDVHEATHRVDKPYLCDLCGKRFKHSNNLRGHKRIHLDDSKKKRHVCQICRNAFRSKFHLQEHMNLHNGNKPYACQECGKTFYKRIQLRQHMLSHGTKKYTCPICGLKFNRRGNMNTHLKRHSKKGGLYTCSICSRKCQSMSELKLHRKEHSTEEIKERAHKKSTVKTIYECKMCWKIFSTRSAFSAHERKHAGEKSAVQCNECGKKLASKSSLVYHMKSIHTQERPHMCQFCGASFVSKEARLIHERIHTGERPYVCNICDMQYRCSSNLSQHMKTHSKVRPYECNLCHKTFTRKGALNVHERIHIGVKPFECDICQRKFSQKNDMLKHKKTHVSKSIKCDICDSIFTTKRELSKHAVTHQKQASISTISALEEYVIIREELHPFITTNTPCKDIQ